MVVEVVPVEVGLAPAAPMGAVLEQGGIVGLIFLRLELG